jgi:hypothetical protein
MQIIYIGQINKVISNLKLKNRYNGKTYCELETKRI